MRKFPIQPSTLSRSGLDYCDHAVINKNRKISGRDLIKSEWPETFDASGSGANSPALRG